MSSGNTRGWTWCDEATEEQVEDARLCGEIQTLTDKWNEIHNEMEYRSFTREYDDESYLDDMDDDDRSALIGRQDMNRELQRDELNMIEDKLAERNARIMRPYEHHGEEERYIEYMETRYDYGGDY